MAQLSSIKPIPNEISNKFWQQLQTTNKMSLKEILTAIRGIDEKAALTVGKFHDKNQINDSNDGGGMLSFLFGSGTKMDVKKNEMMRDQLCGYTLYPNKNISLNLKRNWVNLCTQHHPAIDRSVGCMVGMAIADAVGHPLEFVAITKIEMKKAKRPSFSYLEKKWYNELNRFNLQRGQWTDDCSMGLCIADSLIVKDSFNGSDVRIRFWNWWQNGYNNAFRKDKNRSSSVGLGGNISSSIYECKYNVDPTPRFEVNHDREDSGNGSLMRLGPIPCFFNSDIAKARKFAIESSFTSHPGFIAAESCAFLSFLISKAINCQNVIQNVKEFIDLHCSEYQKMLVTENEEIASKLKEFDETKEDNEEQKKTRKFLQRERDAKELILRLIASNEPKNGLEECWNWKSAYGELPNVRCFYNRAGGKNVDRFNAKKYNGYPVNADYWGSYCMDGLSMALHSVYHSQNFADAVEKCVNMLGDADSTGSICGQLAGAIYGYSSIANDEKQRFLIEQLVKWDDWEVGFRGVLLYILGNEELRTKLLK